jgi:hypothetical protein
MEDRKQRVRQGLKTRYNFKGTSPSYPLPSFRPHLPKFLTTSQNSTTSWEPSIQHMSLWGTFHIETETVIEPTFGMLMALFSISSI